MIKKASKEELHPSKSNKGSYIKTPSSKVKKSKPLAVNKIFTILVIKGETHFKLVVYKYESSENEVLNIIAHNKKYDHILEREKSAIGKKFLKEVIEKEGEVVLPSIKRAKEEAKKNETEEELLSRLELAKKKKKAFLKSAMDLISNTFDEIDTAVKLEGNFIEIYLKKARINGKDLASGNHRITIDIVNEQYFYYYNGNLKQTSSNLSKILK